MIYSCQKKARDISTGKVFHVRHSAEVWHSSIECKEFVLYCACGEIFYFIFFSCFETSIITVNFFGGGSKLLVRLYSLHVDILCTNMFGFWNVNPWDGV